MPKPSVGRIVHYVAYGTPGGEFPAGVCRAAIIAEVGQSRNDEDGERISIVVLNPTGLFFNKDILLIGRPGVPGTCHWPEREAE